MERYLDASYFEPGSGFGGGAASILALGALAILFFTRDGRDYVRALIYLFGAIFTIGPLLFNPDVFSIWWPLVVAVAFFTHRWEDNREKTIQEKRDQEFGEKSWRHTNGLEEQSPLRASVASSKKAKENRGSDGLEASLSQPLERNIFADSKRRKPEKSFDPVVQTDLKFYPRASRAVEYSAEASVAWQKVQSLPDLFQIKFLESLESQPSQKASVLYEQLAADAEKFLRPYASASANDALQMAREISSAAEREFREIYELLQQPDNVDEILKKVRDKFEKLTRADYEIIRMGLSYGDTQTAADKIKRFGYVAKSISNKPNLGGVFTFPDGRTERYYNNNGLASLIRAALDKIKSDNLVE